MARHADAKQNRQAERVRDGHNKCWSGPFGGQAARKICRSPDSRGSQAKNNGLTAREGHGVTSAREG